jgi:AraC-like DNA-binding protein
VLGCDNRGVLMARPVLRRDGVEIADVACRHPAGHGAAAEHAGSHGVVLVRRGCFVRCVDGVKSLLDPTVAYCTNPGEEERYDHPHARGDDCTWVSLDPALVASLWGGEATLPSAPLPVSPRIDIEHRLLMASARRNADPDELAERAIGLVTHVLERADQVRVDAGRPSTDRARRAVADGAREALAANPNRSLVDLAREVAVSPHHLSRVFRTLTGHTVSRHRMRLRTRMALERLAGGEDDLARLAADLGFADQSHLCRVLRDETGTTPSAIRQALTGLSER